MSDTSIPQGYKRCSKCGEVKAVEEFSKDKGNKDGFYSYCRVCHALVRLQYRQANPDKTRESKRRWKHANPDKVREMQRRHREANVNQVRESTRRYREANANQIRETQRQYREANTEKKREIDRQYRKSHPEKSRESVHRRRTRKNGVIHAAPSKIEEILFDVQNGYCMYCQCELMNGYHLDHIVPLKLSDLLGAAHPGHVPTNLCLACQHCNDSKGYSVLEDWLRWKYPDQMDEILRRVEKHIEIMKEWEG